MKNIWKFDLVAGNSEHPRDGACLMDAVSWFTDGTLSDHPASVCPVLAAFCRWVNDGLSHEHRQRLKVFIPRLAGSYDSEHIADRAEYLCRECSERARVALGKTPPVPSRHQTVGHMEAVASANALDLMVIYTAATELKKRARRNPSLNLCRLIRTQMVVDDICSIIDGALKLGKQGEVDPVAMEHANSAFESARTNRDEPRRVDQLQIGRDIAGEAEQEVTPKKRRLAPFCNGRTRNSFWGFDGPDGRP